MKTENDKGDFAKRLVTCKFCDPPGSGVEVYGPYTKTCNVCGGSGKRTVNAEAGQIDGQKEDV